MEWCHTVGNFVRVPPNKFEHNWACHALKGILEKRSADGSHHTSAMKLTAIGAVEQESGLCNYAPAAYSNLTATQLLSNVH